MKLMLAVIPILCLSACFSPKEIASYEVSPIPNAVKYLGYEEDVDTLELKSLLGINPIRVEWCAAFVNAILYQTGIQGTRSNLARSFLNWGIAVSPDNIQYGDIVVFPRGDSDWQGHVGFYAGTIFSGQTKFYLILGGNQDDSVSIAPYPAESAIGIRRINE